MKEKTKELSLFGLSWVIWLIILILILMFLVAISPLFGRWNDWSYTWTGY